MGRTEYEAFEKEPFEEFDVTFDFTPKLKQGIIISQQETGYPKATKVADGSDVTSSCLGANSFSGAVITARVKGGADGDKIKIEFRITDSAGEKHEAGIVMEVRDK